MEFSEPIIAERFIVSLINHLKKNGHIWDRNIPEKIK